MCIALCSLHPTPPPEENEGEDKGNKHGEGDDKGRKGRKENKGGKKPHMKCRKGDWCW